MGNKKVMAAKNLSERPGVMKGLMNYTISGGVRPEGRERMNHQG